MQQHQQQQFHSPMQLPFSLLGHFLLLSHLFLTLSLASSPSPPSTSLPNDAVSLLSFKSKADLDGKLLYTLNEPFDYCQWQGVKCVQGRVVRFVLGGYGLRGTFSADTLTRLDQLRVLSLKNNSLAGPIPNLAGLVNLKSLFLNHNSFSGNFPNSILSLHRILILDLSHNNLSGSIPADIISLDRINELRLDSNRFDGPIPALNQSSLRFFNVSNNNLTGAIPVTPTLSRFGISSFSWNPNLCGEIINKACRSGSGSPFFNSSSGTGASPPSPLINSQSQDGAIVVLSPPSSPTSKKNKRVGVVLGFVIGALIVLAAILCLFALFKNKNKNETKTDSKKSEQFESEAEDTADSVISSRIVKKEVEIIEKKVEVPQPLQLPQRQQQLVRKSGNLIFCGGDTEMYNLEQLMRASAELLGRGTIGTTYKAVMDNRLIVCVKRLDAGKTAITTGEMFETHMEAVGGLRHPNLVPVRAYFQAKEERLVISDYQNNGSLFNLIHGSRSTRAKPLHWTSCLKIAEDVAQGLAYIHQESRLIHGNLKSSNVLLGADFEACLSDYCLAVLADPSSSSGDPDSECYKAPELRKSNRRPTPKSDVYAFGVLLLELLTGKPPSQHPFLAPIDMRDWVRAMRDDDVGEDDRLGMLVDVAAICSLTSPEHRPLMWQVLKMIQEIKEKVTVEDDARNAY